MWETIPPSDLNLVLQQLASHPYFEPLDSISLKHLTLKTAFLTAVTSARRVSELQALEAVSPFLVFHQDKVVLRPKASFRSKVISQFHLNQDIVLPSVTVADMMWTGCLLLFQAFSCTTGYVLQPQRPAELQKPAQEVFLDDNKANTFFVRKILYNSWDFELVTKGNLERECNEEVCNYEEARECFENDQLTKQFWDKYPHNGKGGDSTSSPSVDVAGLVAGLIAAFILLVMVGILIMYCVRYRAKESTRGRPPVNLTANIPMPEGVPLTQLPASEPTAPGLPSYEEALEASGTYDAPPPPYQRGSTRSTQPS
ncbi:transmembrane gamma-carboxyglutamic acid protein 2 [Rhinophrynus dorsalis]